jgi:ubiquinone/menaquinone biosynthesis C-methylase UbiE
MRIVPSSLLVAFSALALAVPSPAQVATGANARYQTPEGRQAVAAGLQAPEREERQKPRELVQAMGLQRGMTVADVGTGIGYMLPFLSRAVGPLGQVIAEDIFDDYLSAARVLATSQGLSNVTFVKGTDKDPSLPEGQVDEVLVLDAYHHFDYPELMLASIHKALKPNGKLVIVEYYKTPAAMPNGDAVNHIRLNKPDVIKEIEANHFRLVSEREQIKDSQYMLLLEKN